MFTNRRQTTRHQTTCIQDILLVLTASFVALNGISGTNSLAALTKDSSNASGSRMAAEDIYDTTLRATVLIAVYDANNQLLGNGTGWIVDAEKGWLLTNHHVANIGARLDVYFPEFVKGELLTDAADYRHVKPQVAKVLDTDRNSDLALLQVGQISAEAHPLHLAKRSAKPGSRVHTVGGSPNGSTGWFSYATGSVRQVQDFGKNTYGNQLRTIETDLSSNRGNSGGAIVNDHGQVVGIVSSGQMERVANAVIGGADVRVIQQYIADMTDLLKMDTADKCVELGRRHSVESRYQASIRCYSKAIGFEPNKSSHYVDRAESFLLLNDPETSLANSNKAIQLDTSNIEALSVRALAYMAQQKNQEALNDWTQAISIHPDGFRYSQRGLTLFRLGQAGRATTDYDRAISMEPKNPLHLMRRVVARVKLEQTELANKDLASLFKLNLTNPVQLNDLGIHLFEAKQFAMSFQTFAKSSRIDGTNAQYSVNAALALQRLGKNQLAKEWFDWALKINPEHKVATQGREQCIAAINKTNTGKNIATTETKTVRESSARFANHPLVGTWSLNIQQNSRFLHVHIRLEEDGKYSGVLESLNDDRTVREQSTSGTWSLDGNQFSISNVDGSISKYTVQLNGRIMNVYENGQLAFSYRKI